ncbi:MAG: glycosyltransferase family 92 protein [Odoribacter sp.]|nr:glycosyltransferase family 92 protein [Odoribacter sp.]
MNKVVAEIIAGLIPNRMARNRWRGILRYGLLHGFKLRRRIRKACHQAPQIPLAICAIAKDEGPYFKEWIEWHRSIGVDRFYLYDNESTDSTREVLAPYVEAGIVEYHDFPGYRMQLAAYDDCLERHRLDTRWIAFIDLDEFIVPIKDKTLPEFLSRFADSPAVEINWLVYGSGGARKKEPGGVMERFRRHSLPDHVLNRHVKSIVNPRRVYSMIGCHEVARISGYATDSHGNPIKENFRHREPQQDIIRINHYAVRSYEEFLEKQNRGRASGKQRTVKSEYFDRYDLNDIEE